MMILWNFYHLVQRSLQLLFCSRSEIAPIIKDEGSKAINHRKNLEEGFLELEAKVWMFYWVCFDNI
jgi:hypothetical protein